MIFIARLPGTDQWCKYIGSGLNRHQDNLDLLFIDGTTTVKSSFEWKR
jgi:hypothetical protein